MSRERLAKLVLLVSSVSTFLLLAYAAYAENFGEDWYGYQRDYKERLLARATDERMRLAAERFQVEHKQLYIPDLGHVDRCVTCHVAVDDPEMASAPMPLSAHPGGILENHPKETFGCVLCHAGQGRATTQEQAHGHVPTWLDPLLPADRLEESCARCHTQAELPGAPRYSAAMKLFNDKGCSYCHRLRGKGGERGPDISYAGDVHDADWHRKHFKDPRSVVETSEMPDMHLSDEEIERLVFLMMSLRGDPIPTHLISHPRQEPEALPVAEERDPLALKGYVGSATCIGCHKNLHHDAVEAWRNSPMAQTFRRLEGEQDVSACLACHATGYNPETGHYSEEGVGCEACHGPGRVPVSLILDGKVDEHRKMNRIVPESTDRCRRCHNPHETMEHHVDEWRAVSVAGSVHGR